MIAEENPLLVRGILNQPLMVGEDYIEFFIENILQNEQQIAKYNLIVREFGHIIYCVMPVVDVAFGRSMVVYRVFVINTGDREKICLSLANYIPSNALGVIKLIERTTWDIEYNTMIYCDFYLKQKGQKSVELVFALKREFRKLGEYSKIKYASISLPYKYIDKPQNFEELLSTNFLGLTKKPYVHKDSVRYIVSFVADKVTKWDLVRLAISKGRWILTIPFIPGMIKKRKKQAWTKNELKELELDRSSLTNSSKNWERILEGQLTQIPENN